MYGSRARLYSEMLVQGASGLSLHSIVVNNLYYLVSIDRCGAISNKNEGSVDVMGRFDPRLISVSCVLRVSFFMLAATKHQTEQPRKPTNGAVKQ